MLRVITMSYHSNSQAPHNIHKSHIFTSFIGFGSALHGAELMFL